MLPRIIIVLSLAGQPLGLARETIKLQVGGFVHIMAMRESRERTDIRVPHREGPGDNMLIGSTRVLYFRA